MTPVSKIFNVSHDNGFLTYLEFEVMETIHLVVVVLPLILILLNVQSSISADKT
jgi:hypothetical protein